METVVNLKKVALVFFLSLTGIHLFSSLMLTQGYLESPMNWIQKGLDLPAILAGILYAFSSLKVYLLETGKTHPAFDILGGVLAAALFITAIVLNFIPL